MKYVINLKRKDHSMRVRRITRSVTLQHVGKRGPKGDDANAVWGKITGNIVNQEDLQQALDAKSNVGHTHTIPEVTGLYDALNSTVDAIVDHITDTDNPHAVTKEQIGLGNVDNTSDLEKPISDATQAALDALESSQRFIFNKPIDTSNPTNLLTTATNGVASPTSLWGALTGPFPTNAWWQNLVLGTGNNRIHLHPYQVKSLTTGIDVCLPVKNIDSLGRNITTAFLRNLTLGFTETSTSRALTSYDDLSATVRNTVSSNSYLEGYFVKGSAYVTTKYTSLTPNITTQHAITSVNGVGGFPRSETASKFKVVLNNGQTWLVYFDSPVTLNIANSSGWRMLASTTYTGLVRVANLASAGDESLLDAHKSRYPTGGNVDAGVSGDLVTTTFTYTASGAGSLLMLALPHQQDVLLETQIPTGYSTVKGNLKAVLGDIWEMSSTLSTIAWDAPTNIDPTKITAIQTAFDTDKSYIPNSANDSYGSGKEMAKAARLALIGDVIGDTTGRDGLLVGLKTRLNQWLNGTNSNPLRYDTTWGGVATSAGLANGGADYGNGQYNDHHFHWGYFIYAAAVLARFDASWAATYGSKVNSLVRDIMNPVADSYFPKFRHMDFFDGHSWAHGFGEEGDAKDQESFSEAINAWYGAALWGLATDDSNLYDQSRILLDTEVRAMKKYMQPITGGVYPAPFSNNSVTGILFATKVDHTTFFGNNLEYINEINTIPVTPVTEEYIGKAFVEATYAETTDLMNRNPTFSVTRSGNVITGISLTSPSANNRGFGVSGTYVFITGGGGSGATATAIVSAAGELTSITVTNGGTGYTSTPTITLRSGNSTGSPVSTTVSDPWKGFLVAKRAVKDPTTAWTEANALSSFDNGTSKTNLLYWIATRDTTPEPTNVVSVNGMTDNVVLTKSDIGLSNADNTSDINKPISSATQVVVDSLTASIAGKESTSNKGQNNGYASLDESGKVPTIQLPSFVDDVVEYVSLISFPATGESGKIYVATDTNLTYRWSGSAYVNISQSLALGETISTAYQGDRGKIAYDHSQLTSGNPHSVTKSDVGLALVDNTSDISKPVSTAQQTAINAKVGDVIADGVTTVAPSQNAVYDALLPKATLIRATSVTAIGTTTKVATSANGSYSPVLGDILAVTLTNGNNAGGTTLNIDGSGAKSVYIAGASAGASANMVAAGGIWLLYYDGTNYVLTGSSTNSQYAEISDVNIIAPAGTSSGLVSGRRAETLMANEASNTRTLANKTINLGQNTLLGTTAQFNAALTDNDFATVTNLDAIRTVTKTLGKTGSNADYICDGVADQIEFNAAMTAVAALGGGDVLVRSGTYAVDDHINMQSNINLIFEQGSTLNLAAGKTIKVSAKSDVIIENMTVNGASQAVNNYGILIENSARVLVNGCKFNQMVGFGIFVSSNSSNTCRDVTIANTYLYGLGNNDVIGGGPANSTTATLDNITISSCHIYQDCSVNNYENGFDIVRVKGVKFIGNHIYGKIQFGTEQFPNLSSDFIGNTVHPAIGKTSTSILVTTYGSATTNAANIIINSNNIDSGQIKVTGISGQLVKQLVIQGNNIKCVSAANAIDLQYVTNASISGNSISTCAAGVGLSNCSNIAIGSNQFDACVNAVNDASSVSSVKILPNHYSNVSSTVYVGGNQAIELPKTSTSNTEGFILGSDTYLYRNAAASLKTDGKLIVGGQTGVSTNSPNSSLHVNGSFATAVSVKSADFTPAIGEHTFLIDATAGNVTATLPNTASLTGREYVFIRTDTSANTVIIDGFGTQTISGALTASLLNQYDAISIKNDGSNWFQTSRYIKTSTEALRVITADTTLTTADRHVWVNTSSGPVTVTYPQVAGFVCIIKKITTDANALTIRGSTGNTEASLTFSTSATTRPGYTVVSNGAEAYLELS